MYFYVSLPSRLSNEGDREITSHAGIDACIDIVIYINGNIGKDDTIQRTTTGGEREQSIGSGPRRSNG